MARVKTAISRASFPIRMKRSPRAARRAATGNGIFLLAEGMRLCSRLSCKRTMDVRKRRTTDRITDESLMAIVYLTVAKNNIREHLADVPKSLYGNWEKCVVAFGRIRIKEVKIL
jgi:hypothetical protein